MSDEREETEPTINQITGEVGDNSKMNAIGQNIIQNYQQVNINPIGTNPTIGKDDLSVEEKELLQAGYMNELFVLYRQRSSIPKIGSANGQGFPEDIKYKRALKRLRHYELITPIQGQRVETYELTGIGDAIVESLLEGK